MSIQLNLPDTRKQTGDLRVIYYIPPLFMTHIIWIINMIIITLTIDKYKN